MRYVHRYHDYEDDSMRDVCAGIALGIALGIQGVGADQEMAAESRYNGIIPVTAFCTKNLQ